MESEDQFKVCTEAFKSIKAIETATNKRLEKLENEMWGFDGRAGILTKIQNILSVLSLHKFAIIIVAGVATGKLAVEAADVLIHILGA